MFVRASTDRLHSREHQAPGEGTGGPEESVVYEYTYVVCMRACTCTCVGERITETRERWITIRDGERAESGNRDYTELLTRTGRTTPCVPWLGRTEGGRRRW